MTRAAGKAFAHRARRHELLGVGDLANKRHRDGLAPRRARGERVRRRARGGERERVRRREAQGESETCARARRRAADGRASHSVGASRRPKGIGTGIEVDLAACATRRDSAVVPSPPVARVGECKEGARGGGSAPGGRSTLAASVPSFIRCPSPRLYVRPREPLSSNTNFLAWHERALESSGGCILRSMVIIPLARGSDEAPE